MEEEEVGTSTLKLKTVLMLKEDLLVAQERFSSEETFVEGKIIHPISTRCCRFAALILAAYHSPLRQLHILTLSFI